MANKTAATRWFVFGLFGALAAPAWPGVDRLEELVVTATRQPERVFDVPVAVSVISAEEIRQTETASLRELFRYTPGVDVTRDRRSRAGEASIQIRGIGGRRVLLLADGMRLPDGFGAAGVADQSRGKLDVESLGRVEVVRGPASSLYGADALGGIVAFQSKRPGDLLGDGRSLGGALGVGYDQANEGFFLTGDVAVARDSLALLLSTTVRKQEELANNAKTGPDPQDIDGSNLLARAEWFADEDNLFTVIAERFRRDTESDRQSANVAVGPPPIRVFEDSLGDDRSERDRLGLQWQWQVSGNPWLEQFNAQLDWQDSATVERSSFLVSTFGAGPPFTSSEQQRFQFQQEQLSTSGQLIWRIPGQNWLSAVTGYEWVSRSTEQLDSRVATNLTQGLPPSNIIDGDVYPQKGYPDTDTTLAGVYTQLTLSLLNERLRIIPGLRYDRYKLDPKPDALFANANVLGFTPVGLSETAWTPRLGVTFAVNDNVSVYANYARGFRPPGPEQINRIGRVPVATFVHDFLPNPDLGPEESKGYELGLRASWQGGYLETAVYENRYEDFIDTVLLEFIPVGAIGNPQAIRRFQSVNIDKSWIRGVEISGGLNLAEYHSSLTGFSLRSALFWSKGEDDDTGEPINAIQPAQGFIAMSYDASHWGGELYINHVAKKDDVADISFRGSQVPHAVQERYTTVDLSAYIDLTSATRLNLQFSNLFDKAYAEWPDLINLPASSEDQIEYFSAPGRALAVSIRTVF